MADVSNTFYASEGNIGYGAQWFIGQDDGSPETFVAVAQVSSIAFGTTPAGTVNTTHLRSPGRAHEKITTIRDLTPFTMTGTLNMRHGSHNNAGGDGFTSGGLMAIHRTQEERNMYVTVPDGSPETELPFRGVVADFNLGELTLEGLQAFTATVQPLSDWTGGLP